MSTKPNSNDEMRDIMIDKKKKIIELLLECPKGLKASEISKKLPYIQKKEVNQILYSNPNEFYATDYVWRLKPDKVETFTFETEYKKSEINILDKVYDTPSYKTQQLADLDLDTFKMAVQHAKELYLKNRITYSLNANQWYSTVVMPEKSFRKEIERLVEQKRTESEKRIAQFLKDQQEKKLKEEAFNNVCKKYKLSSTTSSSLRALGISVSEIEKRVIKIEYYIAKYPNLNLSIQNHIMLSTDEFEEYVAKNLAKTKRKCFGNCATCTREHCIEDS